MISCYSSCLLRLQLLKQGPPRLRCQAENRYVQTLVRSKLPMSRLSCVPKKNSCAQKLIICAFMSRLSCVQKALCPDFRAFKIAYVQTFVRSKGEFVCSKIDYLCVHVQTIVRSKGLMSRLSCVQKCLCPDFVRSKRKFVRSKIDNLCVHVQTIVRSKGLMSRILCVQKCLCPDFLCVRKENSCAPKLIICAFVQTIVRSKGLMSRFSCVQKCLYTDFLLKNLCWKIDDVY